MVVGKCAFPFHREGAELVWLLMENMIPEELRIVFSLYYDTQVNLDVMILIKDIDITWYY